MNDNSDNSDELTFVEGQILSFGGTQKLCDAIERGDVWAIDNEIQQCPEEDRDSLYRIAKNMIKLRNQQ